MRLTVTVTERLNDRNRILTYCISYDDRIGCRVALHIGTVIAATLQSCNMCYNVVTHVATLQGSSYDGSYVQCDTAADAIVVRYTVG